MQSLLIIPSLLISHLHSLKHLKSPEFMHLCITKVVQLEALSVHALQSSHPHHHHHQADEKAQVPSPMNFLKRNEMFAGQMQKAKGRARQQKKKPKVHLCRRKKNNKNKNKGKDTRAGRKNGEKRQENDNGVEGN